MSVARDRMDAFLNPKSIALVGASSRPGTVGSLPLEMLARHGYSGAIFPINPQHDSIGGLRSYPSLSQVGQHVDLVLFARPSDELPGTLEVMAGNDMRAISILSAGFAESGDEGVAFQRKVEESCRAWNIAAVGPNCQGTVSVINRVAATFNLGFGRADFIPGDVAFVSQSGSFGATLFGLAQDARIGCSHWINTGNEGVLTTNDWLEYLIDDPATRMIALYLEGVRDGPRFVELCRRARTEGKVVLALKVGASRDAARIALSHTAAITGSDEVFDAACRAAGVIRAYDEYHLVDTLMMMIQSGRPLTGTSVGVVTASGGIAGLLADHLSRQGLHLPELGVEAAEGLARELPPFAAVANPLDVTAQILNDRTLLERILGLLRDDPSFAATVVAFGAMGHGQQPDALEALISAIERGHAGSARPLVVNWTIQPPTVFARLRNARIPTFTSMRRLAEALGTLREYSEWEPPAARATSRWTPPTVINGHWSEPEVKDLLAAVGLSVPARGVARSLDEAVGIATGIGYPVVLKVVSREIAHKARIGGVHVGLRDAAELATAWVDMDQALADAGLTIPDRLIEAQVDSDLGAPEIIVGGIHDPIFGPVLVVGEGGAGVEEAGGRAYALAPIGPGEALRLLRGVPSVSRWASQGGAAAEEALARLVDTVVVLSELVADPDLGVRELDVNPVIITSTGAWIADGLLITHQRGRVDHSGPSTQR